MGASEYDDFGKLAIKNENDNYRELLAVEEELRISQRHNYEILLEREEDTREFRHNISGHFICLREMVTSGNLIAAEEYLKEMDQRLTRIHRKHISTGNEIMDAMINYYVHQLDEDVEVRIQGRCTQELRISDMDLCSVVPYLMKNASDSLSKQSREGKYLAVILEPSKDKCQIEICNRIEKSIKLDHSGLPTTDQSDKRNHGIGLRHCKKVVEQADGLFQVRIIQKEFRARVILPLQGD